MNITEFRKQYPDYNDIPDQELADKLYQKSYTDMDRKVFDSKFLAGAEADKKATMAGEFLIDSSPEASMPAWGGTPEIQPENIEAGKKHDAAMSRLTDEEKTKYSAELGKENVGNTIRYGAPIVASVMTGGLTSTLPLAKSLAVSALTGGVSVPASEYAARGIEGKPYSVKEAAIDSASGAIGEVGGNLIGRGVSRLMFGKKPATQKIGKLINMDDLAPDSDFSKLGADFEIPKYTDDLLNKDAAQVGEYAFGMPAALERPNTGILPEKLNQAAQTFSPLSLTKEWQKRKSMEKLAEGVESLLKDGDFSPKNYVDEAAIKASEAVKNLKRGQYDQFNNALKGLSDDTLFQVPGLKAEIENQGLDNVMKRYPNYKDIFKKVSETGELSKEELSVISSKFYGKRPDDVKKGIGKALSDTLDEDLEALSIPELNATLGNVRKNAKESFGKAAELLKDPVFKSYVRNPQDLYRFLKEGNRESLNQFKDVLFKSGNEDVWHSLLYDELQKGLTKSIEYTNNTKMFSGAKFKSWAESDRGKMVTEYLFQDNPYGEALFDDILRLSQGTGKKAGSVAKSQAGELMKHGSGLILPGAAGIQYLLGSDWQTTMGTQAGLTMIGLAMMSKPGRRFLLSGGDHFAANAADIITKQSMRLGTQELGKDFFNNKK